ncbi:hypothetical protein LLH23_16890 [bacterium]|nr:hypothetical protein [bacterium]
MRLCLLLSPIVLTIAAVACAAPAGPLVAGTAPAGGGALSADVVAGVHCPDDVSVLATMPPAIPPTMPNYTAPYDEWPDPALVPGRRPAMTADICTITSRRRGTPHATPI